MASNKRKQEDKLMSTLREVAALTGNKHCFDCSQRGPTYVNMTTGSFVCTSCSGILRGLNPPHRVKSISMATFTNDEVDFIKQKGNEYCRKIWLGLYDGDATKPIDAGYKDELQMKDYLITKYEKKRWYVSPAELARQQSLLEKAACSIAAQNLSPNLNNQQSPIRQRTTGSVSSLGSGGSNPSHLVNGFGTGALGDAVQSVARVRTNSANANSLFDSDPFAPHPVGSTTSSIPVSVAVTSGFANFDAFNQQTPNNVLTAGSFPKSQTVPISLAGPASSISTSGSSPFGNDFAPPPAAASLFPPSTHFQSPLMPTPANSKTVNGSSTSAGGGSRDTTKTISSTAADKYSALAELDSLFHSTTSGPPTGPPTGTVAGIPASHSGPHGLAGVTSSAHGPQPQGAGFAGFPAGGLVATSGNPFSGSQSHSATLWTGGTPASKPTVVNPFAVGADPFGGPFGGSAATNKSQAFNNPPVTGASSSFGNWNPFPTGSNGINGGGGGFGGLPPPQQRVVPSTSLSTQFQAQSQPALITNAFGQPMHCGAGQFGSTGGSDFGQIDNGFPPGGGMGVFGSEGPTRAQGMSNSASSGNPFANAGGALGSAAVGTRTNWNPFL